MINAHSRSILFAAILAGTAVLATGCGERSSTETTSQKIDRTADKVAAATERAADKAGMAVDDATITTKVKSAVFAEPGLKSLQIGVDTKDGVVTLSGAVDTPDMKNRAMQIAQHVDGVKSVVDNLAIKSAG
jgi:osmotically-inducible protein OsmY